MTIEATTPEAVQAYIKEQDIPFVDLRFTDPRGKMQHVTVHHSQVDEDLFADGAMLLEELRRNAQSPLHRQVT